MQLDTDNRRDTVDYFVAVIFEAHRQADMVAAFLEATGFLPPAKKRKGKTWYLPPGVLIKLGVLVKLYQWDRAGLLPYVDTELPHWRDVYDDVVGELHGHPTRFSAKELSARVLEVFSRDMSWRQFGGRAVEIAAGPTSDPDQFLENFARLLWDHRHLGKNDIGE